MNNNMVSILASDWVSAGEDHFKSLRIKGRQLLKHQLHITKSSCPGWEMKHQAHGGELVFSISCFGRSPLTVGFLPDKRNTFTSHSQNAPLAVLDIVIQHQNPLAYYYLFYYCLFSGIMHTWRHMPLLPRPGADKGRENGMNSILPIQLCFFF